MSAPAKPIRADASRNRERILVATRELLEEKGFLTQMDDVATRAELGVGTIYRHFPTKDVLFGELVKECFEAFQAEMQTALDEARAGREPFEALAASLFRSAEASASDRGVQDALLAATGPMMAVAQQRIEELRMTTAAVLEMAREAGSIRSDVEVRDITLIMCGVSCTQNPRAHWYEPDGWRRQLQIALDGLRAASRGS